MCNNLDIWVHAHGFAWASATHQLIASRDFCSTFPPCQLIVLCATKLGLCVNFNLSICHLICEGQARWTTYLSSLRVIFLCVTTLTSECMHLASSEHPLHIHICHLICEGQARWTTYLSSLRVILCVTTLTSECMHLASSEHPLHISFGCKRV